MKAANKNGLKQVPIPVSLKHGFLESLSNGFHPVKVRDITQIYTENKWEKLRKTKA